MPYVLFNLLANCNLFYKLCQFITYLIKCGENVVCELYLGDGGCAGHGQPDAEPCNALLAQWSVEHTVLSVLLLYTGSKMRGVESAKINHYAQ